MGRKSREKRERRETGEASLPAIQVGGANGRPPFDLELLEWTYRLTGVDPERVKVAAERIGGWSLPPVEAEFLRRPSIDTAIATVLLSEGIELLVNHGAEETKLLAKLRTDPYPWPTWAEIRAAGILIKSSHENVRIALEPGRARGKQPDFRLVMPDAESGLAVEFKAIGLSDREAEFCRRMGERMGGLVPPVGISTGHAFDLNTPTTRMSASELRHSYEEAARRAADVPNYPDGLSAAVMVGHDSEEGHVRRLRGRLGKAVTQLRLEECWVAFHWTNGASIRSAFDALDWTTMPEHVAGVMFVGDAVVFPDPDIHVFVIAHPRGASDQMAMTSTLDDDYASLMLERVDATAGVRATLARGQVGPGRSRELLRRFGTPRILPFNLVLSGDPTEYGPRGSRTWPQQPPP